MMGEDEYIDELTPEMDIFSLGCVIAELFLEGTCLFTLSQLFKYRSGDYNPQLSLEKIEDGHIRAMVSHMIQIDPTDRYSAEDYLEKWHVKAFPHYFYSFLYYYMSSVTDKVDTLNQTDTTILSALSSAYPSVSSRKLTDADEKIERIFFDFDKIMDYISFAGEDDTITSETHQGNWGFYSFLGREMSLLHDSSLSESLGEMTIHSPGEEGSLILLSFVCSLIRNTLYPSSKLKALDILLGLTERLPDDVKLDRLVPYLIVLLDDEAALIRANTIKTLAKVLSMVESISPINARIFPEYIIPSIRPFAVDPDVLVRSTYASCIATLAETALRFLEMTQLLKSDNMYPLNELDSDELDFESAYDSSLQDLQSAIQEQATILLIDSESSVKRALLENITCLCVFFGRQKANDILLSHMITYLNDKDWMLRSAFFESIKGLGTFVGARSLEEYILPLMIQALTDAEEFVVEKVLNSLTSLADLGLFQKMKLWELIGIVGPLMCHPSVWIRYGVVGFISSTAKRLPVTDLWCIIYPQLRPFLRSDIAEITEQTLLDNTKSPLPRQVYEQAIVWATKATVISSFWRSQREKPQKDELFLERLRSVGMSVEDEEKLKSMRDYIFKVSKVKASHPRPSDEQNVDKEEIYLKNLGVTPMTVFLPDLSRKMNMANEDDANTSSLSAKRNHSRENLCKMNRMANQPHVQALLPTMTDKSSDPVPISAVPIKIKNKAKHSPLPSPSEFNYSSSIPRSLERPKNNNDTTQDMDMSSFEMSSVGYAHLQRLLYKIAIEAFPPHIPEFTGDPAIMKRIKRLPQGTSPFRTITNWKPEGTLIAHYTEHTDAINQLSISWDNLLFASCSDDGSVRIWDCSRLERNVTNRSRAIYSQQGKALCPFVTILLNSCFAIGGRIKCLTFIHQTYSIASASDNGSIHVFR
ncbi:armadillo-type protein [Pilobolus umbonatus]|nr:armadillo-type protein [Pilobolus umbonatus]